MDLQCQAQALALTCPYWELGIMADECPHCCPQRTKKAGFVLGVVRDENWPVPASVTPGGHGQVDVGLGRTGR